VADVTRDVKKLAVGLDWTWKLRTDAVLRKAVFDSSGSLCASRAGPWRKVIVKDIVVLAMQVLLGDTQSFTKEKVEAGTGNREYYKSPGKRMESMTLVPAVEPT
jgi:hypothetical protein